MSLSEGALKTICAGGKVENPVLQVLGQKLITNAKTDRYRMFVSDGQYSNSFSMLATELNEKVLSGDVEKYSIVKVNNYICNNVNGKKVIILLDLDVLQKGADVAKKIGDPIAINMDGTVSGAPAGKRKAEEPVEDHNAAKRSPLTNKDNRPRSSILDGRPALPSTPIDPNAVSCTPIAMLTPYQSKWTIKVRVTNKSDIKRWSNARGEGHLFSMDLLDSSGEIRATAFKEQCDKYYNMIEVGKLFYITSCTLKPANKQYSNLKNDYEMTFRDTTEVLPVPENDGGADIPTISFEFVKIADLSNMDKDKVVDVIGICKSAGDATTITSQRTQKELTKRELTLVDQSQTEVCLTLWGTKAETFSASDNPVVCIKGAKLSDFNGVSLSSLHSSVIQVNPDLQQAHSLKGWYDSEGSSMQTSSLTTAGGRMGGEGVGSNLKSIGEAKKEHEHLSESDKPAYFSTSGYIVMFQKDRALYKACNRNTADNKQCNKKVQDQGNGTYRCEKCNIEIDGFNWRLIVNMSIADMTGNQWVTCFQETAEQILDTDAQSLGQMFENDQDAYNKVFQQATFQRFNFRLSVKADSYNDEQRNRATLRSVTKIDWNEHAKRVVKELNEAGMEVPEKFAGLKM